MPNATDPAALFNQLGSLMEEEVRRLRGRYRLTLREDDTENIRAFSIWREVAGSRVFNAALRVDPQTVQLRLSVRLGSPIEDATVRRYRPSETDDVWHCLSDADAGPFTSEELAEVWGRGLRELLGSLSQPRGHLGTIVTKEK